MTRSGSRQPFFAEEAAGAAAGGGAETAAASRPVLCEVARMAACAGEVGV